MKMTYSVRILDKVPSEMYPFDFSSTGSCNTLFSHTLSLTASLSRDTFKCMNVARELFQGWIVSIYRKSIGSIASTGSVLESERYSRYT